ncbi:MAG: HI1506-related protein [Aeromonas hydrophila]|uniref:HI1506-related protein n=1 Tax=Aeromonas hydrophila TaxID=644 RepID=UPI0029BD5857|nr:HI1506-related protein [Aeromonas hydrophila]MDX2125100.1 HI1506-related protein [Aeromonas hydrophila]
MAIRVRVISKLHQGYHRAGRAIAPGESELVVSAEQCSALEGDPRLVVVRLAEDVAGAEPAPDAPQAAGDLDDAALGGVSREPGSSSPAPTTARGKGNGK